LADLSLSLYSETVAIALPTKPVRQFILMMSYRTETVTVSRMEKAGSYDCRCCHR